eukprot:5250531-Prorocentrum_lima.AAC.1
MTSSLVGSEMCIRDRASIGGAAWHQRPPGSRGWQEPGPLGASSHATVSYTHLTLPTICSV